MLEKELNEPGWCNNCCDYYAVCSGECEYSEPDEEDEDFCLYPGECCMPFAHTSDECHTAEMMEEYYKEMEQGI